MSATLIKPTHKSLAEQNAPTEGNLRRAFSHLLATTAKLRDWTLALTEATTVANERASRLIGNCSEGNDQ